MERQLGVWRSVAFVAALAYAAIGETACVKNASNPPPALSDEGVDSVEVGAYERRATKKLNDLHDLSVDCDAVTNGVSSGNHLALAHKGKTSVVVFWRPSCPFSTPVLAKLEILRKRQLQDLQIISAAEITSSRRSDVADVLRRAGLGSFPVCEYSDRGQTKRWQAGGVPLTLIINARGQVVRARVGQQRSLDLLAELANGWRPS
jgi:hypothetical protein